MMIQAADPDSAGEAANKKGLLVREVALAGSEDAPSHVVMSRKEWRKLASLIRTNVCVGILEALLILVVIGILVLVFVGVRIGSLVS